MGSTPNIADCFVFCFWPPSKRRGKVHITYRDKCGWRCYCGYSVEHADDEATPEDIEKQGYCLNCLRKYQEANNG